MFSKLATVASFAVLAVAIPAPNAPPASQCNTGAVQCCQSVQSSSSSSIATLLGLLGAVVQGVNVPIGVTCSPVSVVGVGSGASCDASPVCCENNNFNGVVALGCTPVDLSL